MSSDPPALADEAPRGAVVDHRRPGARFWITAALGWGFIAVGVRGIFEHTIDTRPASLARFVIGGALLHDLVVAPVVLVAAVGLSRVVRGRGRAALQAALAITGMIALFSYPLVRGYGLAANNPTSLPRNYAASLAIVLGVVWASTAALFILRIRRRRS